MQRYQFDFALTNVRLLEIRVLANRLGGWLAAACTKSGVVDPSHSETRYYGESEDASWAFNNGYGPCIEAMAWLVGPHLAGPTFTLCCRTHYLDTSRLGALRQGLKEA